MSYLTEFPDDIAKIECGWCNKGGALQFYSYDFELVCHECMSEEPNEDESLTDEQRNAK